MLARRRSSRLDEARQAVEQQVEDAFQQSLRADSSDTALLRRKSFGYLPPNLPPTDDNLRVAKQVIQDVYSLQERYDRQHAIENVACAVAMTGVSLVILDNEYFEDLDSKLVLRVANSALTSILLGLICWRFVVERNILIRRNVLPPNAAVIGMPKQLLQLVIELSICAIFVPPGTSGSFTVREWKFYIDTETNSASNGQKTSCGAPFIVDKGNCYLEYSYPFEVLGLLSLLRLYMIPRVIRNLSSVARYCYMLN
ncbi:potassium intermediate small conductance calcium-activated channel, sub N, member [Phytophthora boehmeriae]|uniref:Potassium intermediate small conductance calcium-activated channel, sub N, member n=1 Tax=Phytophthora boehmeriae TaxID=109152 RepID=A0A8T1X909_9STRA|nr:potassium intermediate small conductance calcium-activated channel, sub N, member [Phytophthora boehmeriae]